MTLNELTAYFEEIAGRHEYLKHRNIPGEECFFTLNTDKSTDEYVRSLEKDTILILMPPDKKMLPASAENYNWDKHVAFMALQRCSDPTAAKIISAQNRMELINDDFIRQMIADQDGLISGVDYKTFVQEPVGPISDSFYGYICLFMLVDPFNQYLPNERLALR